MPIDRLELRQFGAFADVEATFVPGINVFIGPNASGKSHLMKLLYGCHRVMEGRRAPGSIQQFLVAPRLREKLVALFRPEGHAVGRLVHRQKGRNSAEVNIVADESRLRFQITTPGRVLIKSKTWSPKTSALFLPTREVLAISEGFTAAYESRELSFDETYYDVCKALEATQLRGPRGDRAAKLMKPIARALGGRVRREGNRFYLQKPGEGKLEAHLVAEGLRKIASVAHLIANGSLAENGVLFWDEPEANLNPRLISEVATFLQELAKHHVQIFIASHDYLLTHRLSLAAEYPSAGPRVPIRFFAFQRTDEGTVIHHADTLAELPENLILEEFSRYYDTEAAALHEAAKEPGNRS